MCLSYGIEPVDKLLADGLHYLTVKHWAEVETGAFDPDWDAVREAENSERMRWFTVRIDGELIGYASVLMVKSLQQKGKEYAVIEDLFVDKEHRKTGAAVVLEFTLPKLAITKRCCTKAKTFGVTAYVVRGGVMVVSGV